MKGRVEFEDTFRQVLHAAIARLGTTGVFTTLLGEIGGREIVRLAVGALSEKEVRRYLDEPLTMVRSTHCRTTSGLPWRT
jgi:hypothetical protein